MLKNSITDKVLAMDGRGIDRGINTNKGNKRNQEGKRRIGRERKGRSTERKMRTKREKYEGRMEGTIKMR